jgi:hypothetical protein
MQKKEFEKVISWFTNEFDEDLTELRRQMLFEGIKDISIDQFYLGLNSIIQKFNRKNMPSIEAIFEIVTGGKMAC